MLWMFLEIAFGLGLLYVGGEAMVRGAVALGRWLDLSPLVVGIIIIGFATSMPELVVSVQAVLRGLPEIATGNILGSNTANILLVLGATALVLPMHHQPRALPRDALPLLLSGGVFALLGLLYGLVHPVAGAVLFLALVGLLSHEFRRARRETRLSRELAEELAEEVEPHPLLGNPLLASLAALIGLGMLVYGGHLFVSGASAVAAALGVSHGLIGLTLVALGTSSPELASALVAARHGHSDVAYGNVVGSNLFNVLGVGGAAAMAGGLTYPDLMSVFDGPVMLAATVLMLAFFASSRGLTRTRGALFVGAYIAYIALRASFS